MAKGEKPWKSKLRRYMAQGNRRKMYYLRKRAQGLKGRRILIEKYGLEWIQAKNLESLVKGRRVLAWNRGARKRELEKQQTILENGSLSDRTLFQRERKAQAFSLWGI